MEFWLEQYDTFDRDAAATDGIQAVLFAKVMHGYTFCYKTFVIHRHAQREQVAPPRSLLQAAQYSLRHAARTHLLSHAYVRAAIVRPLYRFLRSSFSALADSTADIPVDDVRPADTCGVDTLLLMWLRFRFFCVMFCVSVVSQTVEVWLAFIDRGCDGRFSCPSVCFITPHMSVLVCFPYL